MPLAPPSRITNRIVFSYALGSFGTGVFSTVPTVLLLYYCTVIMRIPGSWASAIVFLPKAWAIFWDPVVGAWSDRTESRLGRRRPFIAVGAAGVALAFVALFAPPDFSTEQAGAAWLGGAYFALATLYSLFAVPYIAIPPEVGLDSEARSRLVRWRIFVAMIGVLAGAAIAPLLISAGGGGRAGYAHMAVVLSIACGLAMVAPMWMLRDFDRPRGAEERLAAQNTIVQQLRIALGCHRFVWLALSYLAMLTGAGALTAAAPYLIEQVLGRADRDLGLALGAMLLVTTLTIPLWSALGRRFGDRLILACAAVAYGLLSVGLGLSVWARPSWTATLFIFAALGAPFAAAQVLPFTLLAHLIHEEVAKCTVAEGIFTGMWTAAEKVGLALGPGLLGLALAIWSHARVTIPPFIGIVPVGLMLGALIPLFISRSPAYANSLHGRHAHQ